MKKTFYFKTDKTLGLACDGDGQPSEAYIKIEIPIKNAPSDANLPEAYEGVKRFAAEQLRVDPELVYIISKEEYIEKCE